MTQQAVERTLEKLLRDEKVSWEAGLALSPIELDALSRVPRSVLVRLHDELDKRISRPSLDPDREAGKVARP